MMNSQNFSRPFTSVFEPVTPIFKVNGLVGSAASGLNANTPVGWTLGGASVIQWVNNGVQKYWKLTPDGSGSVPRYVTTPSQSYNLNMGANGGLTYVIVARMNSTASTSITGGMFGPGSGMPGLLQLTPYWNSCSMCYSTYTNGSFQQSITVNKNKFMVFTLVYNNSPASATYYMDGRANTSIMNPGYGPFTDIVTTTGSFFTFRAPSGTVASDTDVMYAAFYDRPLTPNQVKSIYNSIAPVLEIGTIAPLYINPFVFSAIVPPSAPKIEFNALNYTQGNGQSYAAGATGWNSNGVQNIYWSVDSNGRRFINFNQNYATLTKSFTNAVNMTTNGGYSFACVLRINSVSGGGWLNLMNTPFGNLYYNIFYQDNGGSFPVFITKFMTAYSVPAGQSPFDCVSADVNVLGNQIGKCILVHYVCSGTTGTAYINGVQVGQKTGMVALGAGGNFASFSYNASLGINHTNLDAGAVVNSSVDYMYAGFWDRAISGAEILAMYNSVSMYLDSGQNLVSI
jgi:hypothetical protein